MNVNQALRARIFTIPLLCAGAAAFVAASFTGCSDDDDPTGLEDTGAAVIEGRVTDLSGSFGLSGARITVSPWFDDTQPVAGRAPGEILVDTSNRYGNFSVTVPPGSWSLRVDGWNGLPAESSSFPDFFYSGVSQRVDVGPGQRAQLERPVRLHSRRRVEGTYWTGHEELTLSRFFTELTFEAGHVSYPDGVPEPRLELQALPTDWTSVGLSGGIWPQIVYDLLPRGTSFPSGATIVHETQGNAPAGAELELWALDAEGRAFELAGTLSVNEAGVASSSEPILKRATQFFVAPLARDLVGRVVDEDTPLADVLVQVLPGSWEGPARPVLEALETRTSATGEFRIENLQVNSGQLALSLTDDEGTRINTYQFSNENDLGDLQLGGGLQKRFDVTGTVRDPEGRLVPNLPVTLTLDFPFFDSLQSSRLGRTILPASAETDAQGRFSFPSLIIDAGTTLAVRAAGTERGRFSSFVRFTAPSEDDSTTTSIDLEMQYCGTRFDCGILTQWSVEGDTLSIHRFDEGCQPMEVLEFRPRYLISAISNGRIILEGIQNAPPSVVTLLRVGGSGPDGITAANVPGVYRSRGQGDTTADPFAYYLVFETTGIVREIPLFGDAGTVIDDGASLTFDPLFPQEGPSERLRAVRNGDRLGLYRGGTLVHEFERCTLGAGEGFEGTWIPREFDVFGGLRDHLTIRRGEYVRGRVGDVN